MKIGFRRKSPFGNGSAVSLASRAYQLPGWHEIHKPWKHLFLHLSAKFFSFTFESSMSGDDRLSEEMSSHIAFRPASQSTTVNHEQGTEHPHHTLTQPLSQPPSRPDGPSSSSSVSHVDVSFFDPEGVQELKRTLSAQPVKESKGFDPESQISTRTDSTLALKQGEPFDFAKTLRRTLQRCEEFPIA